MKEDSNVAGTGMCKGGPGANPNPNPNPPPPPHFSNMSGEMSYSGEL